MPNLNIVMLMGNLTRDPELRYTTSGSAVCKLGIAVNRTFTDRSGQSREETVFVDVDAWNRQAETCQQYLHKGDPVFIEGRLRLDEWDDRETGRKRSKLSVTANRVQFMSSPNRGNFDDGGGRGQGNSSGGGYNQGSGRPQQSGYNQDNDGGGYNQGGNPRGGNQGNQSGGGGGGRPQQGSGYNQSSPAPQRSGPPQKNAPPFPDDDAPANNNDAFDVDDEEPIDDIPF